MAADEDCEWREGLVFGTEIRQDAGKDTLADAGGSGDESIESCRNWTNTEAISSRKLAAHR